MSDLDLKKTNLSQKKNTGSSQNLKDQVADAGTELGERAGDALKATTDVAQDKLKEAAEAAKDMASGAADHLQDQVHDQQRSGADFVERFAGNIRMPLGPLKATRLLPPEALTRPPSMSRTPPKRSEMEASATSSTAPPIRETPTRRIPWDLGARRVRGDPLSQSIWRSTFIFPARRCWNQASSSQRGNKS